MVAVSHEPSSEMLVRLRPSAATWRSDQPPKRSELAVIEMPPRHNRWPTILAAGSSSFNDSAELRTSSGRSRAPAGGSGELEQAAASRQNTTRERRAEYKMRPSSRRAGGLR